MYIVCVPELVSLYSVDEGRSNCEGISRFLKKNNPTWMGGTLATEQGSDYKVWEFLLMCRVRWRWWKRRVFTL